jgi:uncharacterized protein YceK
MKLILAMSVLAVCSLSGCASIVNGTSQTVAVNTQKGSTVVTQANCKLENDKGVWNVTTPGSVEIHKSYEDVTVTCTKDGYPAGIASFKSSTNNTAYGNILVGGPIGAGVDVKSGAAYDYPSIFKIEMGETVSDTGVVISPAVAVADPASSPAPTPTAPQKTPTGKFRFKPLAEQWATDNSCSTTPKAILKKETTSYETYTVKCTDGTSVVERCEAGKCTKATS